MSAITTHILDTSRGCPAAGVLVVVELRTAEGYRELGRGVTDASGRLWTLLPPTERFTAGLYRLTFHTGPYYEALDAQFFYPEVTVAFRVLDTEQHYHIPLLLSPYGYSTYRGS
jgi:5-hydroxyisourate hydrolase